MPSAPRPRRLRLSVLRRYLSEGPGQGPVVSRAVVVVTGVTATGDREVLGVDVGDSEDGAFWTAFLKGLRARGLGEVKLVISDHHLGLKEAIAKVFVGASWQRCRVHFMRNALAKVPRSQAQMVAAAIRMIFAQADRSHVRAQLVEVAGTLRRQFPDVAAKLEDAGEDLIAFSAFPSPHWTKPGRPTPWSGSTPRSNDGPTWSGSSPTTPRSSGWSVPSSSNSTMSGRWPSAATSQRSP